MALRKGKHVIERFQLLRNVGQFDSVNAGAHIPFAKLALIYGENGRGKTTLAAILRSLNSGDPELITERQRLGSAHPPHIVVSADGTALTFQNGAWSGTLPDIAVFDDAFVAANVCSGIEIEAGHRQNLHELILGSQGVALNTALQAHVARIEEHNRALRARGDAIPAAARGNLSVDDLCALPAHADIESAIQEGERSLAAARAADAVRGHSAFLPLELPSFDLGAINATLARDLPSLQAEAAAHVQQHLARLGAGGETWVSEGMQKVAGASEGQAQNVCPFCAQSLSGSPLIEHYQAYFSEAYAGLRKGITDQGKAVAAAHGGDIPAAFERAVRIASQTLAFWRSFMDVPAIDLDTAAIVRAWNAAREAVLQALRDKLASPLEPAALSAEAITAIEAFEIWRANVVNVSGAMQAANGHIAIVKEQAAAANVSALSRDLAVLTATRARHSDAVAPLCQAYLDEKTAKTATEEQREQARAALDQYRDQIFPAYETAINAYLQRFNAGFRLGSVQSVNTRAGSACQYNVVINNVAVSPTATDGPSFRNTLSAGDRNALALAFFFASLDQDPALAQKIVVIDDPMTSLDEHRSLTTIHEVGGLLMRVQQVMVFSHSKRFLCDLWEDADPLLRSAAIVARDGGGSTLAAWDVNRDCISEHDRRHELVTNYLAASNPADERNVAVALRPILEKFTRVAYPAAFPPGSLLGPFINVCQQRVGTASQILGQADVTELRAILDYANKYHHNTNAAYETEAINDQELLNFAERTLKFTRRV